MFLLQLMLLRLRNEFACQQLFPFQQKREPRTLPWTSLAVYAEPLRGPGAHAATPLHTAGLNASVQIGSATSRVASPLQRRLQILLQLLWVFLQEILQQYRLQQFLLQQFLP